MALFTTTSCKVQNVTGSAIVFQISNDWQGAVGGAGTYPSQVLPDATATFQHIGNQNGSQGAVVYRVQFSTGTASDVVVAWSNPPNSANKAFTLVDQAGSFSVNRWPAIFDELSKSGASSKNAAGGVISDVQIGEGNFPTFSATISTA